MLTVKSPHLKTKNGFTLIELLVVLWMVSLLMLLVTPSLIHQKQTFEVDQFFDLLYSDVLFIQQQAIMGESYKIIFRHDKYVVVKVSRTIEERFYPKSLKINNSSVSYIQFSINGNVIKPTTYSFKFNSKNISVVFPLGRGRFYLKE